MSEQRQYLRRVNLWVVTKAGDGLDLSGLRIKFSIKKSDAQTPNTAEIRLYNVADATAHSIRHEFTRVVLQAGYESHYGVIFDGNIIKVRVGRENGTDGYLDIAAGDGDQAYNYAIVNHTLAAGATQGDQLGVSLGAMAGQGAGAGSLADTGTAKLPRGKALYGMARDYLRHSARAADASWSIQDGKVQLVPLTGLRPSQVVVLTSKTGLVGTPEQTDGGIKARCLLNPLLVIGGQVQINEQDIAEAALPDTTKKETVNDPVTIEHDGLYRLLLVEHTGDSRGAEWYSDLVCLGVDATQPPAKKVKRNG